MSTEPKNTFAGWRRTVLGLLAISCLGIGGYMYFTNPATATGLYGMLIRLGLVLSAIWLALPQLGKITMLQSAGAMLLLGALVVLAASRPNLFRVAISLVAIGLALNWGLKWISLVSKSK